MYWVQSVLRDSDLLYSPDQVEQALARMARSITATLGEANPLILVVMIGGLIPAGRLVTRLPFPLELDYVHVTRYRRGTTGGDLQWRVRPTGSIRDRVVLLIDDILDEGITLGAIMNWCEQEGAQAVYSAVLVEKQHDRKPILQHADFSGLEVEDRYVFGCGMDYQGYLRNIPGIHAVKGL
nr:hypoxanthine-guanine phosphoribosyltransferase [Gammaproteobacteria bacterium]